MNEMSECTTCGMICRTWIMFEINTGRRKQYQCPKCYLKGQSDTGKFAIERIRIQGKTKIPKTQ